MIDFCYVQFKCKRVELDLYFGTKNNGIINDNALIQLVFNILDKNTLLIKITPMFSFQNLIFGKFLIGKLSHG